MTLASAPTAVPDAPAPAAGALGRLSVGVFHAGWGLGVVALAGLALLFAQAPPPGGELLALALIAAPGLLAMLPGPVRGRGARLLVWTAGVGAGVALGGGVAGPLGAATVAPALAGLVLGAWMRGLAASFLLAGVVSVLGALGGAGPLPSTAVDATALASGLLALTAAAAVAAGAIAFRTVAAPASAEPGLRGQLAEAQAARARAEGEALARARFLAEMSHELRTPLNAIMGFSDIMRTRLFGPLPDRYAEYAELIHESGGHLTDLINDVLDMSKIDADRYELRRELFDARDPVAAAVKLLRGQADTKRVALYAGLPSDELPVDADPRALKQITLNLLTNALKFTPAGGEVTLTLSANAGALELTVADTGVGIAPQDLERLGRPYEQAPAGREVQGTGLGLSLVRAFARLHGGELTLESRVGEGTAATVRLPVLATT